MAKMLEQYNAKRDTYDGQKLTEYDASQRQRYIERQVRRWKREKAAMQAAGFPTDEATAKLRQWNKTHESFLKQTGMKRQVDRLNVGKNVAELSDRDIIRLDKKSEDYVKKLSFSKVSDYKGKLSDRAVRKWYIYHDEQIPSLIDKAKPVEEQARQACDLRILHRTQARDLMRDQEKRKLLDHTDPNCAFENLLAKKMQPKGLNREETCKYIVESATRTRKSVNQSFGLE